MRVAPGEAPAERRARTSPSVSVGEAARRRSPRLRRPRRAGPTRSRSARGSGGGLRGGVAVLEHHLGGRAGSSRTLMPPRRSPPRARRRRDVPASVAAFLSCHQSRGAHRRLLAAGRPDSLRRRPGESVSPLADPGKPVRRSGRARTMPPTTARVLSPGVGGGGAKCFTRFSDDQQPAAGVRPDVGHRREQSLVDGRARQKIIEICSYAPVRRPHSFTLWWFGMPVRAR